MLLGTISIFGGGAGGGAVGLAGGRAGGGPEGLAAGGGGGFAGEAEGNGGLGGGASLISPLIESFSIVGDCTYTKVYRFRIEIRMYINQYACFILPKELEQSPRFPWSLRRPKYHFSSEWVLVPVAKVVVAYWELKRKNATRERNEKE